MVPKRLNFAVIICSTSRYQRAKAGEKVEDASGDLISQSLRKHGHDIVSRTLIPDNKSLIKQIVTNTLKSQEVDAIIVSGGTGVGPRDVTVESVRPLLEKELPGFGEIFRMLSYKKIGSAAILSQAVAGVSKGRSVFCIPGSPHAVLLCVEKLILPEVGHILKHAREMDDLA